MDWKDFLNEPKGLLIAPAGHGKTHAIAECLNQCPNEERQLILTHTHAGIAAIRLKLKLLNVNPNKYHIDTITGFAQRYALAFFSKSCFPEQDDNSYFDVIIEKSIILSKQESIKSIIRNSYSGLFVDEYQDCSKVQHTLIMQLSEVLPTHILGDELQGIFDFAGRLVNFGEDLQGFKVFKCLNIPWRWHQKENCKALGNKILLIRQILESDNPHLILQTDKSAHLYVIQLNKRTSQEEESLYYRNLHSIVSKISSTSVLIIVPSYFDSQNILRGNIADRSKLKSRFDFENQFTLIEAIDAKDFYSCAKNVDDLLLKLSNPRSRINKIDRIRDVLETFTLKNGDLNNWFAKNNIKNKRGDLKRPSQELKTLCNSLITNHNVKEFLEILLFFTINCKYRGKRPELLYSIQSCLKSAIANNISVYDSMVAYKNRLRRVGRKIEGKCIGTTLLTKGLEFDTVIILDANFFSDSRHFYVAISRACNNLIILTGDKNLQF